MKFDAPVYPIAPSFDTLEELELDSTKKYLEYLRDNGASIIMSTAGTSQYNLMSWDEIWSFNQLLSTYPGKKILGLPAMSLLHIEKDIYAYNQMKYEDTSLLLLFPERYYSDDQIVDFFKRVCEISNYPILVHGNILKRGNGGSYEYSYDLLKQLSEIDGFVGMKEESSTLQHSIKNIGNLDLEIIVAGGSMRRFWTLEPFGATTYLTGVGSFNPIPEEKFYNDYMSGDLTSAKKIMEDVENPLFKTFMQVGWHASMRHSLKKMGFILENRNPFCILNDIQKQQIEETLNILI